MPSRARIKVDPEYKLQVERVLALYYQGVPELEIAEIEGIAKTVVNEQIVAYCDPAIPPAPDAERLLRDQKIAVMHAAGFNNAEIAKTFGIEPKTAAHAIAGLSGDLREMAQKWKETTLEAGFASREMRIWSINKSLLYLEEEVDELEKVFTKTPEGNRTYQNKPTGKKIMRKFEKDQYGRPIWGVYQAKLLDELGKLKGDHSANLNLGLNPETRQLLEGLNVAHRRALPMVQDAEFSLKT